MVVIKIFDRYLANIIFKSALYVLLFMTGIIFIFNLLAELRNIGQGDYGFYLIIWYVVLRIPSGLYEFFPLIILTSCLWGLTQLAQHRELLLMQTLGWSKLRLISSILVSAMVLNATGTVLGEIIVPDLNYRAAILKEMAQHAGQAAVTHEGVWFRFDKRFVHVEQIINRTWLQHLMIYEIDNEKIKTITVADRAIKKNNQWEMQKVNVLYLNPQNITQEYFEHAPWNISFNPQLLRIGLIDPEEMSLKRLWHFSRYLRDNAQRADEYEYPFWQRLLKPFIAFFMLLAGLPLLFKVGRNIMYGWQLLQGLMIGILFYLFNAFLSQVALVWQWYAWVAAGFPLVLLMLFCWFMLWRMRVLE